MSAWQDMQYQEREEEMARNEWHHFVLVEGQEEEEREKTPSLITSAPQKNETL